MKIEEKSWKAIINDLNRQVLECLIHARGGGGGKVSLSCFHWDVEGEERVKVILDSGLKQWTYWVIPSKNDLLTQTI